MLDLRRRAFISLVGGVGVASSLLGPQGQENLAHPVTREDPRVRRNGGEFCPTLHVTVLL
jgi:hypothetical protein